MKFLIYTLLVLLLSSGCSIMHHAQLSEVDSRIVFKGKRFEILVSELGVNFKEVGDLAQGLTQHSKTGGDLKKLQEAISLFQMGPRTGNSVFDDKYADKIFRLLKQKCPSGKMSGITSIRETAKYPLVSGEIVKIIGYCKS